ncbi:15896_t:CDS:2, partial [Gigaspora rosea]
CNTFGPFRPFVNLFKVPRSTEKDIEKLATSQNNNNQNDTNTSSTNTGQTNISSIAKLQE